MNNSTISQYDSLIPISIKALKDTILANIGFIILGLFVTVSNVLEFVTIVKDKKLRTRCYFLIANLSIASILNAVSFIILGLKRLIRLYYLIPEVNTKRNCAGEMFTCSLGQTSIIVLPLATAMDRICAAAMPIKYKNMNYNYAIALATLGWLMALTDTCFSFYGNDQSSLVANCNLASATEMLYQIQTTVELIVTAFITLCYVGIMILLRKRMKSAGNSSEGLAALRMKFQMQVAKTLIIDSVVHLITQTASRIGLASLTPLPPEIRFQYGPFIRLLIMAGSGLSLIIFLKVNNGFKMAFRRTFPLFFKRVAPVESMTVFTKFVSSNRLMTIEIR